MSRFLKSQPHPLPFLLRLEWVLLAIVAATEIFSRGLVELPRSPLLNLSCGLLFALMGLYLPNRKIHRLIYTFLELEMILLMSFPGGVRLFQLLYIVFIIRNCVIFRAQDKNTKQFGGLLTVIGFGLCVLTQLYRLQNFALPIAGMIERNTLVWVSMVVLFGLVVIFLQLLVGAIFSERESREKLAAANLQLRRYALEIEELATVQERNRIAREIHDSLGHSLTAFNLHLEAALKLLQSDPNDAKALIVEAKQIGAKTLQDVRQSVATLRTDPIQGRSLEVAIAALIEDFTRATGISPSCQINIPYPLSKNLRTAIYRIVQESLTNISKHAAATEIEIYIQALNTTANEIDQATDEEINKEIIDATNQKLEIIIKDNGKGFNQKLNTTGFGLQGMRERTLAFSGSFEILTAPSQGCQITACFPLTGSCEVLP
jgi:signal transduction histidine kinase